MVVESPNIRWDKITHDVDGSARAGVYYLETAQGEKVVCAAAVAGEGNRMTYKPFDSFLTESRAILPSMRVAEWHFRFQLDLWLDAIVYYCFLQYSGQGVESCWHLAYICLAGVGQRLLEGLRRCFRYDCPPTWTLIVHGYRFWPVQVIGHRFSDGWDEYCAAHNLTPDYKVIFACERKWIFHTVILDGKDREVRFHWSGPNLHCRQLRAPLANLRTSCLPSAISHQQTMLKFGHLHLPIVQLYSIFMSPMYEYLDTRYDIKGSALAFLFNKRLCAK